MSSRDGEALAQGVVTGGLAEGQLVGMKFLDGRRDDLEVVAGIGE
jgi:hypothetical protein